jgi:hypothetical protein
MVLNVDLYPKGPAADELTALANEHGVSHEIFASRGEGFFKLPLVASGDRDPSAMFWACGDTNNCPILRGDVLYPCAYVAYADVFAAHFGLEGFETSDADGINLFTTTDPWDVFDFLTHPIPWCRFCALDQKRQFSWSQAGPAQARAADWLLCD